jgi:V8-like Glu-specific endopeptidase
MTRYLSHDDLNALYDAGLTAGYADNSLRPLLLEGILPKYRAALPLLPGPGPQLRSDLNQMNQVERLIDGTVPLEVWLRNAVEQTTVADPLAVFRRTLDNVASAASGEPDILVDVRTDEFKEAIIHRDDMVPFAFLRRGDRAGLAVACIKITPYRSGSPDLTGRYAGTGWLIAPQLLITNHHVVNARSVVDGRRPTVAQADFERQAADAIAQFDYEAEETETEEAQVTGLEASDQSLDYAILRLAQPSSRPALQVRTEPLVVTDGEPVPVNIIQHASGQPKRVALRNNLVHEADRRDIRYFTDTRNGSSGSPVCTDGWTVVALHRGTRQVTDVSFQGKDTAFINVGTQMSAIMQHLNDHHPGTYDEITAAHLS